MHIHMHARNNMHRNVKQSLKRRRKSHMNMHREYMRTDIKKKPSLGRKGVSQR